MMATLPHNPGLAVRWNNSIRRYKAVSKLLKRPPAWEVELAGKLCKLPWTAEA